MKLTRIYQHLTIFGVAAMAFTSLAAQAVPTSGMPTFGSVDIQRLQNESTKKAAYDNDLHDMAQRLDAQFKLQADSVMLSKEEQLQLGDLLSKPKPTDQDTAQINALEAKATKDAKELTDLQQTQNQTSTQAARMAALGNELQAGKAALNDIGDTYQAQLKKASDADNADFTKSVKDAIAVVAKQQGLAVVFTSDIAVYTANDITDEVIKRLNK